MNTLKTVAVDLFDTFQAMKPAERLEILSGDEFDIVDSWLENTWESQFTMTAAWHTGMPA